ncbi:MAG: NAD-dependent deacylase [Bacteroidota bacterium]
MRKKVVILSGAGISAESGIKTFRDAGGLWEGYDVMEVASPGGWAKNPELVTDFYNQRRLQLAEVTPNAGHRALKTLEKNFNVSIITQNVDDLHERAGSSNIIHLHGELSKMRSTIFEEDIYEIGYKAVKYGDKCPKGTLLRPHIVWFGEAVPLIIDAAEIVSKADILIVVGTSLEVYPAAGLINGAPGYCQTYLIDPNRHDSNGYSGVTLIKNTAANALPELVEKLIADNRLKH